MSAPRDGVVRANLYRALPETITADPADNSRQAAPSHPLDDLIASILEQGQLSPITVRKVRGKLRCVFGFRRLAAITEINRRKLAAEPITIAYQVRELDDEGAFRTNLAENLDRDDLSPIDKAYAIDRLKVAFNQTNERVAGLMHLSPGRVSQIHRLLDLPPEIRAKVHSGEIGSAAAYELLGMDKDRQRELVKASTPPVPVPPAQPTTAAGSGNQKPAAAPRQARPAVSLQAVRKAKRDTVEGSPSEEPKPRTRAEILEFWTELSQSAVPDERGAAELAEAVVKHCQGKLTDRALINRLVRAIR